MARQIKKLKNIIIPNPKKLEKTIKAFMQEGADKIHILSGFDSTLTRTLVNGEKVNSLIAVLRNNKLLTPDYRDRADALFNKFYPIEHNPHISFKEKKRAMHKWWILHFNLLIKAGFSKKDIAKTVKLAKTTLRAGGQRFFKLLGENKIPLIIMSASGLGRESVKAYLKYGNNHTNNIHIISNSFIWNKNGRAIGYNKPIIHSVNKDETLVKNFPAVMKKIKLRTNVVLMGDMLEDLHMITGFNYDHLIKIGFLNENIKTKLPIFKKHFDVILLNDAPMYFVNQLLKKITAKKL